MTDVENWWKAIRSNPEDCSLKLVFADWCEDQGLEALARALREYVEVGWQPADLSRDRSMPAWCWFLNHPKQCGWERDLRKVDQNTSRCRVPQGLFHTLLPHPKNVHRSEHGYQSEIDEEPIHGVGLPDQTTAIRALIEALATQMRGKASNLPPSP